MFEDVFTELNLGENAHRVYSQLIEHGASSARQLAENLNIPRPSVYDNLKILIQKGLVVERFEENKKIFQLDDIKNLPRLMDEKIDSLKKEKGRIDKILPDLIKQTAFLQPKIKFYSGIEGVKQVLNDIMWYKDMETYSMWPVSEMVNVLGKDYFADLNRNRIRRNIFVKGIWPQDKVLKLKDYPYFGTGGKHLRELRLAPKNVSWDMGSWQYADKVAFISSRQETFGFVIHSRDFSNWQKAQFEMMWKASKPVKPEPQYTDAFLKTV